MLKSDPLRRRDIAARKSQNPDRNALAKEPLSCKAAEKQAGLEFASAAAKSPSSAA